MPGPEKVPESSAGPLSFAPSFLPIENLMRKGGDMTTRQSTDEQDRDNQWQTIEAAWERIDRADAAQVVLEQSLDLPDNWICLTN